LLAEPHLGDLVLQLAPGRLLQRHLDLAPLAWRFEIGAVLGAGMSPGAVECGTGRAASKLWTLCTLARAPRLGFETPFARFAGQAVPRRVAREVEDDYAVFATRWAQRAPDLLQVQREGRGRTEQDRGANRRNVDAFVEKVTIRDDELA
jgi:hypothetical protein